jgi:F-type H+-transporting ATPase subunit delta
MSSEQTGDRAGGAVASEEDMETAHNYAEALLKAAESSGQADGVLEEIEEIDREVYRPHPQFVELLNTSQVSEWERERIADDLFKDRASDLVYRFLRVLNRHGRLGLLPAVAVEMRRAWNRRHNRVPVVVRTAVPLDDAQRTALAGRVGRMIGATPILDLSTDPSLIGGMVIKVGDYVYDASVKNRLEQLRQRLIEGKTHEIQSRRDQFSHSA